jgi:hypothetical protein
MDNSNNAVLDTVKVSSVKAAPVMAETEAMAQSFNPMNVLSERQRIALASRWAGMKDSERDEYAEYSAQGITDSATLYAIATITQEANTRIFSESRAVYLGTMAQWYLSLVSKEDAIRKFAETELEKLRAELGARQQQTLLSALKAKLLEGRTFLPEVQEKAFRALCRFYGFDMNLIK